MQGNILLRHIYLLTTNTSLTTHRVGALGVIMIWVRLLFYARATEFIGIINIVALNIIIVIIWLYVGPMVAMIGQLSGNVAQYLIILSVIFIPYCTVIVIVILSFNIVIIS